MRLRRFESATTQRAASPAKPRSVPSSPPFVGLPSLSQRSISASCSLWSSGSIEAFPNAPPQRAAASIASTVATRPSRSPRSSSSDEKRSRRVSSAARRARAASSAMCSHPLRFALTASRRCCARYSARTFAATSAASPATSTRRSAASSGCPTSRVISATATSGSTCRLLAIATPGRFVAMYRRARNDRNDSDVVTSRLRPSVSRHSRSISLAACSADCETVPAANVVGSSHQELPLPLEDLAVEDRCFHRRRVLRVAAEKRGVLDPAVREVPHYRVVGRVDEPGGERVTVASDPAEQLPVEARPRRRARGMSIAPPFARASSTENWMSTPRPGTRVETIVTLGWPAVSNTAPRRSFRRSRRARRPRRGSGRDPPSRGRCLEPSSRSRLGSAAGGHASHLRRDLAACCRLGSRRPGPRVWPSWRLAPRRHQPRWQSEEQRVLDRLADDASRRSGDVVEPPDARSRVAQVSDAVGAVGPGQPPVLRERPHPRGCAQPRASDIPYLASIVTSRPRLDSVVVTFLRDRSSRCTRARRRAAAAAGRRVGTPSWPRPTRAPRPPASRMRSGSGRNQTNSARSSSSTRGRAPGVHSFASRVAVADCRAERQPYDWSSSTASASSSSTAD